MSWVSKQLRELAMIAIEQNLRDPGAQESGDFCPNNVQQKPLWDIFVSPSSVLQIFYDL